MSDHEKHSEDPLEQLFREKSEEYNIEYNEKDWLKLEERLDKADRQHHRQVRRRWIAAAVILAFAFLTYLTVENQLQINRLNEKLSQYESAEQEQPTQVQQDDQGGTSQETGDDTQDEIDSDIDSQTPVQKELAKSDQQSPVGQDDDVTERGDDLAQKATPQIAAAEDTSEQTTTPAKQPLLSQKQPVKSEIGFQSIAAARMSADEDQPLELSTLRDVPPGIFTREPITDPATSLTENTGRNRAIASANRVSSGTSFKRLALGLVLGPDLSTVGSLSNFYDPGHEYGLTVEYNVTPNFGIATGVVRARVLYTAGPEEYNPSGNFWNSGTLPNETIGDCVLLDIPLRFKYNFWKLENSRFYATGGISSYIMLNEEYKFDYGGSNYGYGTSSNQPEGWSDRTGTKHWMSNVSLSVGYERDIMQNWSLRAEPYLKVPVKEVGWGNVELYSMGMTVSLNYKMFSSR